MGNKKIFIIMNFLIGKEALTIIKKTFRYYAIRR